MKKGIIYKYTFPNGKIYIGQTIDLDKRHYQHMYCAKNNKGKRILCDIAIAKYGEPKLEIIEEIIEDKPHKFKQALNEAEVKWINEYNATDRNVGYNIQNGGHTSNEETYILEEIYLNMLDEQKDKISNIRKILDSIIAKVENNKNVIIKNNNAVIFTISNKGYISARLEKSPKQNIMLTCLCNSKDIKFTFLSNSTKIVTSDCTPTNPYDFGISDVSFSPNEDCLYKYGLCIFSDNIEDMEEILNERKQTLRRGKGIVNKNKLGHYLGDSETVDINQFNLTKEENEVWFNLKFNYGYETTFDELLRDWLADDFNSGGDGELYAKEFKETVNEMFDYFEDDFKEKTWKYVNQNKEKLIEDFFENKF